jgi:hypothetical protein
MGEVMDKGDRRGNTVGKILSHECESKKVTC